MFWWLKHDMLDIFLQLRHVMDPKRHFKRSGKSKALPKYFQVSDQIASFIKYFGYLSIEKL